MEGRQSLPQSRNSAPRKTGSQACCQAVREHTAKRSSHNASPAKAEYKRSACNGTMKRKGLRGRQRIQPLLRRAAVFWRPSVPFEGKRANFKKQVSSTSKYPRKSAPDLYAKRCSTHYYSFTLKPVSETRKLLESINARNCMAVFSSAVLYKASRNTQTDCPRKNLLCTLL